MDPNKPLRHDFWVDIPKFAWTHSFNIESAGITLVASIGGFIVLTSDIRNSSLTIYEELPFLKEEKVKFRQYS